MENNQKRFIILICFLVGLISCNNKKTIEVNSLIQPIEKWTILWKNDSIGCNQSRFNIISNNNIEFKKFIGSHIDSFEMYFGKANNKKTESSTVYYYLISCKFEPKYKFQLDTTLRLNKEPTILRINVNNDIISDINVSLP